MSPRKKRFVQFGISVVLIAVGVVGFLVMTASKPEMKKRKPPAPVPMVRTIQTNRGPQTVYIRGEGTVRPLREINLVPEVGGKVVRVSPALVNGGVFGKDNTLLQIDPVDYELAVTLAKAKVKDAESRLELAEEEALAAVEEWRLLYPNSSSEDKKPPALVAKEPQLAAAQARLEADKADLRKALLNLERTRLKAPFDGRVGEEKVDIGQYVSPGQTLGTLYSTEAAEIVVPLEGGDLFWFDVPAFTSTDGRGASAVVRASIAGRALSWPGKVVRTEGRLDERTRMIHVVVRVDKPYARKPPLVFGLFVTVEIEGRKIENAAIIPRGALHQSNVVWVLDKESRLRFREVEVARVQGNEVLVTKGLADGETVITTPLKAVTDGMAVRKVSERSGVSNERSAAK
ncbi:MAG: efflux RND transporter periplasmic adaptor subunit [Deltaproteobacteria bacterium]|nr:MAG: efflux RND transporter periplasmic adaptor subunit [Deltaproteobacteria bacterium]